MPEGSTSRRPDVIRSSPDPENSGPTGRKKRKAWTLEEFLEKQDPEEKAEIGREFREMQIQADDMNANLANYTAEDIINKQLAQDRLFEKVKDTSLASLDAKLLLSRTEAAMGLARKVELEGNAFNIDDFLIRIKGQLGLDRRELEDQDLSDEDELDDSLSQGRATRSARKGTLGDWEKLGWMSQRMSRRVTGVEFMYGPLAVEAKKRKTTGQRRKRDLAPEQRPENIIVEATQKDKTDDPTANVRIVFKILQTLDKHGEGINFFKFVINPKSFGQTVENVFYVSFLIKEGKVGIDMQDDGEILIRAIAETDDDDDEGVKNQAVMELDIQTWVEAKRIFKITSSAIPHRDYSDIGEVSATGWYT